MRTRHAQEGQLASAGAIHWQAEAETLRCLSVNEHARCLGFPRERWLREEGFLARTVFAPDRELFLSVCRAATRGASLEERCQALAADGSLHWFELELEARDHGRERCIHGRMVESPPEGTVREGKTPLIIAHFDREYRHLYVNRGVVGVTGLPASFFIGRTNEELGMPSRLVRYWREKLQRVFQREEGLEFEFEFPPRDEPGPGESMLFQAHLEPIFDSQGNVRSVRCETYRLGPARRPRPPARASPPPAAPRRPRGLALLGQLQGSLGTSASREDVLRALGQLVGTELGDWCEVDLLRDGVLERAASFLVPGGNEQEPSGRVPTPLSWRVALTGAAERLSGPSGQVAAALAADEARLLALQEAGLLDCMAVPLRLGERVLGVLTFATREPSVRFGADTLTLAESVAGLAAWALEADRLRGQQKAAAAETLAHTESEALYRTILAALWEGIVVQARDGNIVTANARAGHILGLSVDQMTGRTSMDPRWRAIREDGSDFPGAEHPAMVALRTGGPVRGVLMGIQRPDGTRVWLSVNAQPLQREGEPAPYMVVSSFFDVTETRRAEQERARLLREAQEAVRARDEFLSVASHELRTPLTSLRLQLHLLLREEARAPSEPTTRLAPRAQSMDKQLTRLAHLVDSLMDVSRLSAGQLKMEAREMDLGELVQQLTESCAEEFRRTGSELHLEKAREPLVGVWDPRRMEQVVMNLLSNAARFGAGKPVEVRLSREGEQAVIVVEDHGIGISEDSLPRIFGKFERAVSERHYGGLGLGLYITRHLVDAMGGTITAESRPGEGATFTVRLPLVPLTSQARSPA